jgi:hypothetical protein
LNYHFFLKVQSLRSQLEEAQDDLKRDEDIFAEKVREVKKVFYL